MLQQAWWRALVGGRGSASRLLGFDGNLLLTPTSCQARAAANASISRLTGVFIANLVASSIHSAVSRNFGLHLLYHCFSLSASFAGVALSFVTD